MSSLPSFKPYVLSHVDHTIPPLHLPALITFRLDDPNSAIPVLEAGILRLFSLLPFLSGNIAFSTGLSGKKSVREMQPPTEEDLSQNPIFRVRHHDLVIPSEEASLEISSNHLFNRNFTPGPFEATGVSPALRFQANVMLDGIILSFILHHQALDGAGIMSILESLAVCCRNPRATLDLLSTTPAKEQATRQKISEAAFVNNATTDAANQDESTAAWKPSVDITSQHLVSRKFVFSVDKIAQLQKGCASQADSMIHGARFSSNAIVTAVLWICLIRARFGPSNAKDQSTPATCSLLAAVDFRSRLKPSLPLSYMGNAVGVAESHTPIQPILSSPSSRCSDFRAAAYIDPHDTKLIADLATNVGFALQSISNEHIRQLLSKKATAVDWTPEIYPGDFSFSSLRFSKFYDFDFGPFLGRASDFDLPENRIPGVAWALPPRGNDRSSPWEVRLTLDPDSMEKFSKDKLIGWLSESTVAKL